MEDRVKEHLEADAELEPLFQYLDMLKANVDRFKHLETKGASDTIISREKDIIERQFIFLESAFTKLSN